MSLKALKDSLPLGSAAQKMDGYFNGEVPLTALGINIPPNVRVLEMTAPYPRMSVDVLAEVLTFIGFTLGEDSDDERLKFLQRAFQINNMDTLIRGVITEALVQGAGYFIVGPGDPVPRVTAHPFKDVSVHQDWLGNVTEALVRIPSPNVGERSVRYAYYTPGSVSVHEEDVSGRLSLVDSQDLPHDVVPVVPMINRARVTDRCGRSEMLDVLKLSDAASRSLTSLQLAQELEAMPKRWIFADGIDEAFEESGMDKLEAYMGYMNLGPDGGNVQQLQGASLDPIINSYKLYAQIISAVTGIPSSMMGITTDNPSSAEAMRVARDRLTSRGEAKQAMFGDDLEHLGRVYLAVAGKPTDGLEMLEAVWRDVATPSKTSQQAMAFQAFQAGGISARTFRDFLDLTPAQREREDERELSQSGMASRAVSSVASVGSESGGGGDPEGSASEPVAGDAVDDG